jgi:hypothetical protein
MNVPKKYKAAIVAPGFRNDEIYEAASQNYMRKINAIEEKYALQIPRGSHIDAHVKHDDWCRALNGGVGCNCNPDVSITVNGVTYK